MCASGYANEASTRECRQMGEGYAKRQVRTSKVAFFKRRAANSHVHSRRHVELQSDVLCTHIPTYTSHVFSHENRGGFTDLKDKPQTIHSMDKIFFGPTFLAKGKIQEKLDNCHHSPKLWYPRATIPWCSSCHFLKPITYIEELNPATYLVTSSYP